MIAYEFYSRDEKGKEYLFGILRERRGKPERITNDSIVNLGSSIIGNHSDVKNIHFIRLIMYGPKK